MITILITTFNDAHYLFNSIKSILLQRFNRFELLIIDDGSTDKTSSVIGKFRDRRIKYIKIKHRGRSGALNYGLRIAKYEWVFLLDADDLILPQTLDKYSNYLHLEQNTVISSFAFFYKNNKIIFYLDYPTHASDIKKFLYLHSINNTVLYNRNFILDTMGGYNESLVNSEEDYELWLRIINYTNFMMLSDYLVIKGVRTDSYSMRTDRIKKQKVYLLQNSIYSKSNFPEYVQSKRFLGWRELFYGNKNESRKILLKLGPKLLISPKIILAIVITTLPEKVVRKILKYNIKLRLLYYQKYFSQKSINIRKEFNKIVKNHS